MIKKEGDALVARWKSHEAPNAPWRLSGKVSLTYERVVDINKRSFKFG
jgi:hypothetical protein